MEKKRIKTRYVELNVKKGNFMSRWISSENNKYDFSDIAMLRQILSKEKAKILYTLKNKKISSIYSLSKILKRDFKSVWVDLKLLERFGLIEFYSEKKGKRKSLMPILAVEQIQILVDI